MLLPAVSWTTLGRRLNTNAQGEEKRWLRGGAGGEHAAASRRVHGESRGGETFASKRVVRAQQESGPCCNLTFVHLDEASVANDIERGVHTCCTSMKHLSTTTSNEAFTHHAETGREYAAAVGLQAQRHDGIGPVLA
jgi:hypothetical protein